MDYRLKQAYQRIYSKNTLQESNSSYQSLTNLYTNLLLERAVLSNKTILASLIAKAEPQKIAVNPTSKDIRIQPIENFASEDLIELFNKLDLTLVSVIKPGQPGATSRQLLTYLVKDKNGIQYSIVLGKGRGFGVKIENQIINDLNNQIQSILKEKNKSFILLNLNGHVEKINGIRSTPGTPKSDFEFIFNETPKLFVSHKAGATASDYQQYGGTTCISGKNVCSDPEVESFVQTIKKLFPEEMPSKTSVYRKIKNKHLKMLALFGMDYGKQFGINNVHALFQGNLKLIPTTQENEYVVKANHVVYNGELPTGPYEPVLYGRFSASRGGNHGIKNLRTGILPMGKISNNTKPI